MFDFFDEHKRKETILILTIWKQNDKLSEVVLAIVYSFACSSLQANLQKPLIQTYKKNRDLHFLSFTC